MKLLLIRHGQSEADVLNVHEGRADYPLTELGRTQGKAMAAKVESFFKPEIIWSSTLKRAAETTDILTNKVGCNDVRYVDELMEQHNGILAGMPLAEAEKIPLPQYLHEAVEGGETFIEFRMRMEHIFSRIIHTTHADRIIIVAHGGVLSMLLNIFMGNPVDQNVWFITGDTGMHLLEKDGEERLVHFLNDTGHLSEIMS